MSVPANGCGEPEPYAVRLHVPTPALCTTYEAPLQDAIAFWADHGASAFVYEECRTGTFEPQPTVIWLDGERAYTEDLEADADYVAVYVVEQIVLDTGTAEGALEAAGLVSATVDCPALVATTTDRPVALAHELGHLLWLDHSDGGNNLMYRAQMADDLLAVEVTESQITTAVENWRTCRRNQE